MTSRREFLYGMGALGVGAATGGCFGYRDVARLVDDARAVAKVGVLANTAVEWKKGTERFDKALRFFAQNGVDAVVLTGQVTKNGYPDQFKVLDQVWKAAFGKSQPRRIMDDGAHDVCGFRFAVSARKPLGVCATLTFHGEGRNALTDDLGFYPREAMAVYAGSMSGIDVPAGYVRPGGQKAPKAEAAAQGLLVTAYSGRTVIRRLDFTQDSPAGWNGRMKRIYAEDVADPWVPGETPVPPAPEFWSDTNILAFKGYAGLRSVFTVRWPHVLKRFAGARAFGYELTVAMAERPNVPVKRVSVLSDGFFLAESRDLGMPSWRFMSDELPKGRIVFGVTPFGSVGHRGKTRYSEPLEA